MALFENYLDKEIDALKAQSVPEFSALNIGKRLLVIGSNASFDATGNSNDMNGGTYTVTFDGDTTGPIPWNDDGTLLIPAMEALPSVGPGNFVGGGGFTVGLTFQGALGYQSTLLGSLLVWVGSLDISNIIV